MTFLEFMKKNPVLLDGSTGTLLQRHGLKPSEGTETWNLSHPEIVRSVHQGYFDVGSNVVVTNTFGASARKYPDFSEQERLIRAAVDNAAYARENSHSEQEKFIALDLGPLGAFLEPFGDLDFEEAAEIFAKAVRSGCGPDVDLIMIETMMDLEEAKAALTAAKACCSLPVIVSHTYNEDGHTLTGADPFTVVRTMESLGADAVGLNCSFGPDTLKETAREYLKAASVPVSFKPNAGLPKETDGVLSYNITPDAFAEHVAGMAKEGVRLVGGCCGTDPDYILALAEKMKGIG